MIPPVSGTASITHATPAARPGPGAAKHPSIINKPTEVHTYSRYDSETSVDQVELSGTGSALVMTGSLSTDCSDLSYIETKNREAEAKENAKKAVDISKEARSKLSAGLGILSRAFKGRGARGATAGISRENSDVSLGNGSDAIRRMQEKRNSQKASSTGEDK